MNVQESGWLGYTDNSVNGYVCYVTMARKGGDDVPK